MRIGVDATCWLLPRGYGRHARNLLTALRQIDSTNEYVFFTDAPEAVQPLSAVAPVRLVRTSTPTLAAAARGGSRSIRDLLAMSRAMSDRALDLLLFPTVYSYVPVFSRARKLLMIHDVIADRFPELTLDGRRARWFWSAKGAIARRQADVIATVSEYARQTLVAQFGLDANKVHVVGEASDPVFRRMERPQPTERVTVLGLGDGRRMIVYVGGYSPHKNLPRLVEAFGRLAGRADLADTTLVLVGDYEHETFHTGYHEVRDRIRALALEPRVVLTRWLADPDLVALLNLATVLVLPSMTEGFGLPAVEAAACGCPVIATTESPLPALLGEGGLYVDPRDPAQLHQALDRVLSSPDLQDRMRQAGMVAASRLTWTAAAGDLLRLIQGAAS